MVLVRTVRKKRRANFPITPYRRTKINQISIREVEAEADPSSTTMEEYTMQKELMVDDISGYVPSRKADTPIVRMNKNK